MDLLGERQPWDEIWLSVADAVAQRSSCTRSRVGSVVVVDNYWVYVGYNRPTARTPKCVKGGCPRGMKTFDELVHDAAFNTDDGFCTAVHAEMNAIRKFKANHGVAREGVFLYSTRKPCDLCIPQIAAYDFPPENIIWRK